MRALSSRACRGNARGRRAGAFAGELPVAYPRGVPQPELLVPPLLAWFAHQARDLPWRHTRDPYAVWIAEVMLQQTQVATVVPYWERWQRALPDVAALARAPLERVLKLWEGLGSSTRARQRHRAARQICREHAGVFPRDFAAVLGLPGIGRYTAGAICSLAFNQPTPVLDGNVTRVLTRVFGIRDLVTRAPTQRRLWALAETLVRAAARGADAVPAADTPDWRARRVAECPCGALNEALMELGATVCTPRQPRCEACPLAPWCVARERGWTARLPRQARRPAARRRRVLVFVGARRGRWLVWRRPDHGVNAGLWEFPSLEVAAGAAPRAAARRLFGAGVAAARPWLKLRHSITTSRIAVEVFRVDFASPGPVRGPDARWVSRRGLAALAFTAVHRRVADRLLAGETA